MDITGGGLRGARGKQTVANGGKEKREVRTREPQILYP